MKWNWGKGIVLGMITFMAFIMFMVVKMTSDTKYNHDLVTTSYYEEEIKYQEVIDAAKNTNALLKNIKQYKSKKGWVISFPDTMNPEAIQGSVSIYRPSDQSMDKNYPIILSDSKLLIPNQALADGRWDITLKFEYLNKPYFIKKQIVF